MRDRSVRAFEGRLRNINYQRVIRVVDGDLWDPIVGSVAQTVKWPIRARLNSGRWLHFTLDEIND